MRLNIFNQKILALMLTIAALMTGQTAWAVLTWTGDGSSDNPYQIDTYEKLKEFAAIVNGEITSACAKLTADIECTDNTWTPIGTNEHPFMGTFDGCGHTITGLSNAGVNPAPMSVGLFGNVGISGNVRDVILVNVALSGKNSIGSIAGFNRGNVQKCYVANSSSGSISATENSVGGIGGIVGYNKDGTIQNCHYSGSGAISANNNLGGAIVGFNNGGTLSSNTYHSTLVCAPNIPGTYYKAGGTAFHIGVGYDKITSNPYGDVSGAVLDATKLFLADNRDNTALIAAYADPANHIASGGTAPSFTSGIDVTLQGRTLWKDGAWNTLCLPFSMTAEQIAASDLAGADIRTLDNTSFANGTLTLNFTPATGEGAVTSIAAGKPYIIKWASGNNLVNPTFTGVTIGNTMANVETGCVNFIGTYSPINFTEDDNTKLFLGVQQQHIICVSPSGNDGKSLQIQGGNGSQIASEEDVW